MIRQLIYNMRVITLSNIKKSLWNQETGANWSYGAIGAEPMHHLAFAPFQLK